MTCKGGTCDRTPLCSVAGTCQYRSSADEARERITEVSVGPLDLSPLPLTSIPGKLEFLGTVDGKGYKSSMDQKKIPLHLIPPSLLLAAGRGLKHGALKYAAYNWMRGMNYSEVYAALQRHLLAWLAKEDTDPDSGLSHLDHAVCCLAFLTHYTTHTEYQQFDDRVFTTAAA